MRTFSALLFGALAIASLSAGADQKLVSAQSEITFITKQMGVPLEGKFRQFGAQVVFDPRKPEAAKIEIAVDVASATLGVADTDAELVKPDWFSAKLFPQATFKATTVKSLGNGKFEVSGKLAIKSIVHDVVVPLTLSQSAGNTVAVGTFSIKRLDYRIGEGDWKDTSIVADPVQVSFKLLLSGVTPL